MCSNQYISIAVAAGSLLATAALSAQERLTLTELQRLTAPAYDLGRAGASAGWSVAVDGDFAVVGAPRQIVGDVACGVAYVLEREGDR